jgi:2-polyprenyl-3-methyl-5-hydroxy-6-metoxy-1,4-benzoquinol methylase
MSSQTREFIDLNGEWTAMAIRLGDGTYTRAPAADFRLRRLIQAAQDAVGKPLKDCRVLDLACLEGHYALELAAQGAEAVGIDARDEHLIKCNYAKDALNLTRCSFLKDDVRNLSRDRYGQFDIVICSGILYHLKAEDAVKFIQQIAEVTKTGGIVLIDTFVSLFGRTAIKVGEHALQGHHYFEHYDGDDEATKTSRLWASIDNATSFWLTEPSLINLLMAAGFTTVATVQCPTMPGNKHDRRTYLACRGTQLSLRTSDVTQAQPSYPQPESPNMDIDASQRERSWLFKSAKRALPSSVKNAIKPLLRGIKLLEPDGTPQFMKKGASGTRGHSTSRGNTEAD